jgi:hypothetical protein
VKLRSARKHCDSGEAATAGWRVPDNCAATAGWRVPDNCAATAGWLVPGRPCDDGGAATVVVVEPGL